MKHNLFLLAFIMCMMLMKSQSCSPCSFVISHTDTSSYTVSSGQTMCIDSSANMFGKITLNGGTICNKGFFNPKEINFISGVIYNNSNLTLNNSITLPAGIFLTIAESSVININGDLILNNSNVTNNGFINISGNIQNNNGILNNNNVINCNLIIGSVTTNPGIINKN